MVGDVITPITELSTMQGDGRLQLALVFIFDKRVVKRNNRPLVQLFVH